MSDVIRTEGEPSDRLTAIADSMIATLEEIDPDVKAVVMLTAGDRGGVGLHGWNDDTEAVAHVLDHLRAVLKASGIRLEVMTI